MGFLGLLKFALLNIHFLAWPVIALGYPLIASIRAIETDSKYHMKKLVTYWTIFSLISTFEFVFVKIIEWIPFWSSVKLIAIVWLAIPRFHGACYAYQRFIRPCLVAHLQEVISAFEEQKRRTKESFLDVVDNYIMENGFDALEKLIATKRKRNEPEYHSQRDTQVTESDEKKTAATSKPLKEPVADRKDNELLETTEKSAATEAKQLKEPVADRKDNELLETTEKSAATEAKQAQPVTKETYAAALVKNTTPHESTSENKQPSTPPPVKKIDKPEWRCPLCQVTTSCENNLNDHLRGQRHKAMCEYLKSSKLNARPSSAGKDKSEQESSNQQKPKDNVGVATQHLCFLCNVKIYGDVNLASHLKGKRHALNVETNWQKMEGLLPMPSNVEAKWRKMEGLLPMPSNVEAKWRKMEGDSFDN